MDAGLYICGGVLALLLVTLAVVLVVAARRRRQARVSSQALERATAAANLANLVPIRDAAPPQVSVPISAAPSTPAVVSPIHVEPAPLAPNVMPVGSGVPTPTPPLLEPEAEQPSETFSPVELWFDTERTALAEDDAAFDRLRHYADELLGDLKAAKRRAR